MQVRELMAILEDQDPDAEVLLVTQRQWPFEYSLSGVSIRSEVEEADDDEDEDGDDEPEEGAPRERSRDDGAPTDVLLVEGRQLRYGSETAWNVARR